MAEKRVSKEEVERIIKECRQKIGRERLVKGSSDGEPRYVLFHSASSISSESVRIVLDATGQPHVSHDVSIPEQENYSPEYVNLRKVGWYDLGQPALVGEREHFEWMGSTAVAINGFDLCALPTLVDLQIRTKPKVIVNSEVIFRCLAKNNKKLMPCEHLEKIEKRLHLVDDMPHGAYIYDGNPIADNRPGFFGAAGAGRLHKIQMHELKARLAQFAGKDQLLEQAYRSKLTKTIHALEKSKEAAAGDYSDYLSKAYKKGVNSMKELEKDLAASKTGWICSTQEPALADLLQAATVHRILWLRMVDFMLADTPNVRAFLTRVLTLPSLQRAVVFFPGAIPSLCVVPYVRKYIGELAVFLHLVNYHFFNVVSVIAINLHDLMHSASSSVLILISVAITAVLVISHLALSGTELVAPADQLTPN